MLTVELLIPLSHPSELVTHPALCRTFKSNKIRVLAEQALDSIRAEHAHMTKLSRLLSVLLGDENILAEPEEIIAPRQPMEDSESDKDVDIMDLDEPAKTNGETNGHSMNEEDVNGIHVNGTTHGTNANAQPEPQTLQAMETDEPSGTSAISPSRNTAYEWYSPSKWHSKPVPLTNPHSSNPPNNPSPNSSHNSSLLNATYRHGFHMAILPRDAIYSNHKFR